MISRKDMMTTGTFISRQITALPSLNTKISQKIILELEFFAKCKAPLPSLPLPPLQPLPLQTLAETGAAVVSTY